MATAGSATVERPAVRWAPSTHATRALPQPVIASNRAPTASTASSAASPSDVLMFSGDPSEHFPTALLLDRRLTPIERNAWQVLRWRMSATGSDRGSATPPTYEELRPHLASIPGAKASHETVARALALLRLTGWITLSRQRRSSRTGRLQGNIYTLHDAPLRPSEILQLDPTHLELVAQSLSHASKVLRQAGAHALQEIRDDPLTQGQLLPERLQRIKQVNEVKETEVTEMTPSRHATKLWKSYPQKTPTDESEVGDAAHFGCLIPPLRIPKQAPNPRQI